MLASAAQATFHENLIRQVHEGSGGGTGDYVELQAYAAGQNFVANKYIVAYDGGGTVFGTPVLLSHDVPNGANQASVLIAHDQVSTPGADFYSASLKLDNTNGYVCYQPDLITALDCVAYGNITGAIPALSPVGSPALPATGFSSNTSLTRSITRGCATALDTADDTNNSAADFAVSTRTPRSNSQTPTDTVCPPAKTTHKCKKKKKHHSASAKVAKKKHKKCKKKHKKKQTTSPY